MRVSDLLRASSSYLKQAGVEWSESESLKIFALACQKSEEEVRIWQAMDPEVSQVARNEEVSRFKFLLERRGKRVPLQHLAKAAPFASLDLEVGPGVFVPRPETEVMPQIVSDFLSKKPRACMADLCAGSGAVGLEVCHSCRVQCFSVEKMALPFRYLQKNISKLRKGFFPGSRCIAVRADALLPSTLPFLASTLDCVASNPPYLSAVFQPEASLDPPEALFGGGKNGMKFISALLPVCYRLLKMGGLCIIEHESGQSAEVFSLFSRTGFKSVKTVKDLSGRDRFTQGVK
ncbi:MAG: peptide chain release factor N(5)-glutamine methyltransferase [Aeriscardovia sp.]|nr:peptide chain release factor N(5)-glutamine methyltransferase [Aeriscardovia sp.]